MTITCSDFIRKRWLAICCNGWREFGYSRYGKLKIIWVFSTETTRKSGMVRKLRQSSFRRYLLGGAVFRVACTSSARLIHCIADSGKPGLGFYSIVKRCPGRPGLGTEMVNKQKIVTLSNVWISHSRLMTDTAESRDDVGPVRLWWKCGSSLIQMCVTVGRDRLCLILWHVVMPPITRGQIWLSQHLPVSTVPNTGRSLCNRSYRELDEEDWHGYRLRMTTYIYTCCR